MRATQGLAPDLRRIFLDALAARPQDPPTLAERLHSAGREQDRSARVIRRRLDQANQAVAANLLEAAVDDRGWFVGSLSVDLEFAETRLRSSGRHEVVVTAPHLTRLTEWIGAPDADVDDVPDVRVTGARLIELKKLDAPTWEAVLELPQPASCGDLVTYQTQVVTPIRKGAMSFSAMSPRRDCWHFSTTVRFGGVAASAVVLDGVTFHTATSDELLGRPLELGDDHTVSASFENLTPGLVYGIKWRWAEPGPGAAPGGEPPGASDQP